MLFLLVESCQPNEVVRLVAIGDRRSVVPVPSALWSSPVTLRGTTALLPIDPGWFGGFDEFQVLVVRDTFGQGLGRSFWFADAVTFAAGSAGD